MYDFLLQENGDKILLEVGNYQRINDALLLESSPSNLEFETEITPDDGDWTKQTQEEDSDSEWIKIKGINENE